ncbi:three-helix bundle dimerization domain-containing protein [Ornithinimicrobium sp. Y1847]|uniref:arsenate reductase/protein-tyrosine-phosphatase family protein n=1 Tax=Ornithinimicrobium sp. Y1847 TaxID=3405419 RepID=UPI003B66D50D
MDQDLTRQIIRRLTDRYNGAFTEAEVEGVVTDSIAGLEPTNKAPQFLPVLVEKFARERLIQLADAKGVDQQGVLDVLFICNGNAGRSQMAAAFANAQSDGRIRAWSAGVNPLGEVLPDVVAAMEEKGIDLSEAYAKPITADATSAADYVVAIGVPERDLPVHGRHHLDWDIDPVIGQDSATTRRTRDEIERRVTDLVTELTR